jgi:uncharacterized protein YecE (DUF72 family)
MNWHLGTMGFAYQDWEGGFYPESMPARRYLGHYSRFYNALEIDSTFYGTPSKDVITRWRTTVPDDFIFCLKTPRMITHELGLVNAIGDMNSFLETVSQLDEHLGVVLLQFPPAFRIDRLQVLSEFLDKLPPDIRFAVEFRDQSWYTAADAEGNLLVESTLSHCSISWASTDYPGVPSKIYRTAPFLYIRWIGHHGRYQNHSAERVDLTPRLEWWWRHIKRHTSQDDKVYGFFNNDYAGHAPATCKRFKTIAGIHIEDIRPPRQGRLF